MTICPHETPGGRDKCALCRAEDRLLTDPHADHRHEWRQSDDLEPMPDWFRDRWHQLTHKQQGRDV